MKMYELVVFQEGEKVTIYQEKQCGRLDELELHRDQIPVLCKWLMQLAEAGNAETVKRG